MTCVASAITGDAFVHTCLEALTRLIPGSTGVYYLVDDNLVPGQHILAGISPETHQAYLRHFLLIDPLHPQRYNDQPVTLARMDESIRRSSYYRQFMVPNAMGDMTEIFVRQRKQIVAGLSLMRDKPFSLQEQQRLRAALPLIELATEELTPAAAGSRLTPKEQMIVGLVREGACNKRIASQLGVSLSTVKTHLRNIFSKTNASNRTELVAGLPVSHDRHYLN
ncbi:helix-turn-helix transcriptional regulator [Chimaeribacter californicus]|uniref:Helix-turn-helix transcriptional regulator n=1 Tax=Chimaeribacter californicus TaxID=2060067 RepID=A0A2N5E244_9GAMM|nr:LuxR C-terminal-related transcriptional regulator [Chimaeribacter californicus]PLR34637.1 helix-turn-helix transcriptional regulator [Chimaeribacter californicus]